MLTTSTPSGGFAARVGSMVDMRVVLGQYFLQPISATDLSGEFMTSGSGDLHARCVGCDALPQPSHGDAYDRSPGAVEGRGDRALVGRRQALRAGGKLSSTGVQT